MLLLILFVFQMSIGIIYSNPGDHERSEMVMIIPDYLRDVTFSQSITIDTTTFKVSFEPYSHSSISVAKEICSMLDNVKKLEVSPNVCTKKVSDYLVVQLQHWVSQNYPPGMNADITLVDSPDLIGHEPRLPPGIIDIEFIAHDQLKYSNFALTSIASIDTFNSVWDYSGWVSSNLEERKRDTFIKNVGSSTRIEGSLMTDEDVANLIAGNTVDARKQDQEEVIGCVNVQQYIDKHWQDLKIDEDLILFLHDMLLTHSTKDRDR